MRYYHSKTDAHNALCLDMGFDPFSHHGRGTWRRCTKANLAAHGYVVDPVRARELAERAQKARELAEREAARQAEIDRGIAAREWEAQQDLAVMRRVADAVAATGAPVAHMELWGDRHTGTVRLRYHDGRKPTTHRLA